MAEIKRIVQSGSLQSKNKDVSKMIKEARDAGYTDSQIMSGLNSVSQISDQYEKASQQSIEYERRMQFLVNSNANIRVKDIQKYSKQAAKQLGGNKHYLQGYESGRWNRIAEEDKRRRIG